jgi:ferritin
VGISNGKELAKVLWIKGEKRKAEKILALLDENEKRETIREIIESNENFFSVWQALKIIESKEKQEQILEELIRKWIKEGNLKRIEQFLAAYPFSEERAKAIVSEIINHLIKNGKEWKAFITVQSFYGQKAALRLLEKIIEKGKRKIEKRKKWDGLWRIIPILSIEEIPKDSRKEIAQKIIECLILLGETKEAQRRAKTFGINLVKEYKERIEWTKERMIGEGDVIGAKKLVQLLGQELTFEEKQTALKNAVRKKSLENVIEAAKDLGIKIEFSKIWSELEREEILRNCIAELKFKEAELLAHTFPQEKSKLYLEIISS